MKFSIIADILIIAGILLIAYGLWLKAPWVSYTVVGVVLAALGLASMLVRK